MLLAIVVLAIGGTGLMLAFPAAAAVACPSCYGFAQDKDGIFVERSTTQDQRRADEDVVDAARARVRGFYGTLMSHPRILLCSTEGCYARFGGRSRGLALLNVALFLSPRGTDVVIAAHELAHIELHSRIGLAKTVMKAAPQWFDEGLAVVVSDDPRYLAADRQGDRCLVEPQGDMPSGRAAWIETAQNEQLYAKAACRVSRWIDAHGGPHAIVEMTTAVARGEPFDSAAR